MIKKFNEAFDNNEEKTKRYNDLYQEALTLVTNNFKKLSETNSHPDLYHYVDEIINLVEGFDEDLCDELRKKLTDIGNS